MLGYLLLLLSMLIGELLQEYFHCNQFIKRSGYAYLRNKLFFWIMRLIPKTLLSVWLLKFIKTSILSTVAVLSSIKTFNKLCLVSKELIDYDMQTLAFVWWSYYFSYCWMRVVLSISEIWKTKKKNLLKCQSPFLIMLFKSKLVVTTPQVRQ